MQSHSAAGKLQGFGEDKFWYEASFVVGITQALNVVADGLARPGHLAAVEPGVDRNADRVYDEIKAFYDRESVPSVFMVMAGDPAYLKDFWVACRRAFDSKHLSRRLKESLAFAVSLATGSLFGIDFHLSEMRRLGVTEKGVLEVVGVTQMFSSLNKIADFLQLEPDMSDIAPVDESPAPGVSGD